MPNTRDITCRVELYDPMTFMSGPLKQNDTTRLIINVYRDGRAYDLDGLTALLSAKLGDSPVYFQTSDYVTHGHTLIYNLAPPIVAQEGYIELEIVLTDASDNVVSSFTLGSEVIPMLLNDEDIPEDERTDIIDAARAAAQSVAQARAARDEAESAAERAEQVAIANGYVVLYIGKDGCLYQRRTSNLVDKLTFWTDEKGYLWVRMK